MLKKKSYMNKSIIINEDIFDKLKKWVKTSILKADKPAMKKVNAMIDDLNKDIKDLEMVKEEFEKHV